MNEPDTGFRSYYTMCLDIQGKPCLVAGGGEVARRKTVSLCDCGAKVTVVSPTLDSVLEYMAFQNDIEWKNRTFDPDDLSGIFLAIAATDDRSANRQIAALCQQNQILCNATDSPHEGNFTVPSTVERGPLTIAVSTSGISPTMAATIRKELELTYGEEYGAFLSLLSSIRPTVQRLFDSPMTRQYVFDRMISSRALSLLRDGLADEAQKELESILYDARQNHVSANPESE